MGSPGSTLFSMPHRPEPTAAASARYGLASAAAIRYSTRVDLAEPGMTRSARGAVLDAPARHGRRPEARDQPAVGVHGGRHHGQKLGHQRLLAADELAHGRAHAVRRLLVVEGRLAVLPQRHVHVAAAARPVLRPLGHEGGEPVALLRQHLGEELEQRGAVGGGAAPSLTLSAASSTPAPVSVCRPSMPMSMASHMASRSL